MKNYEINFEALERELEESQIEHSELKLNELSHDTYLPTMNEVLKNSEPCLIEGLSSDADESDHYYAHSDMSTLGAEAHNLDDILGSFDLHDPYF